MGRKEYVKFTFLPHGACKELIMSPPPESVDDAIERFNKLEAEQIMHPVTLFAYEQNGVMSIIIDREEDLTPQATHK